MSLLTEFVKLYRENSNQVALSVDDGFCRYPVTTVGNTGEEDAKLHHGYLQYVEVETPDGQLYTYTASEMRQAEYDESTESWVLDDCLVELHAVRLVRPTSE